MNPRPASRPTEERTVLDSQLVRKLGELLRGTPCWLTGGAVRDAIIGRTSADADLVVAGTASTSEPLATKLADRLGTSAHLVGRAPRAVWRIEARGLKLELWPLAELSLEADAARRDYTCNALMWRLPDGPLIDLVGGVRDITTGRLRAISRKNLAADPVRLLRGPRFLAELPGFELDPETACWIAELAPRSAQAPRERIGAELLALSRAPRAVRGFATALQLNLWAPVAPPCADSEPSRLRRLLPVAQTLCQPNHHPVPEALTAAGAAPQLGLLMAAWGITDPSAVAEYAWPKDDRLVAGVAARLLPAAAATAHRPPADRRELIHSAGVAFPAVLALAAAFATAAGVSPRPWRRWWSQWRAGAERLLTPRPLLTARDVMALTGALPGPRLGELLGRLERAAIRGEIRSPAGARRLLRKLEARLR